MMPSAPRFLRVLSVVFAGTAVIHLIGFVRQAGVAAYFGLGRDLDIYLLVLALATATAFAFAYIFDTVAVPRLSRIREEEGERSFRLASGLFLLLAATATLTGAGLFKLAMPPLLPFVAPGFSAEEVQRAVSLVDWFLPWAILSLPQLALASLHRASGRMGRIIASELVSGVVSCVAVFAWHPHVEAIAVAYAAGCAIGILVLLPGLRVRLGSPAPLPRQTISGTLRNVGEMFVANQADAACRIAERALLSLLPSGSIAAWGYAALISGTATSLLTFREAFLQPLSTAENRAERLERILCGLVLLAVPAAGFMVVAATPLLTLALERGAFDAAATAQSAFFLAAQALTVPATVVKAIVTRMFLVLDRNWLLLGYFLAHLAGIALLGTATVVLLGLGVMGFAVAIVLNTYASTVVACLLLHRTGLRPRWWRVLRHAAGASVLAAIGAALAQAVSGTMPPLVALPVMAVLYALPIAAGYYVARGRLRKIVTGAG
jgi:putative peptidoglycan lipid II flippase